MNEYSTFEKIFYTFLIILAIFIMGIQVGIFQGKELQRQGYYEYSISN
jgi:cell division protein FtsL